MFAKRLAEKALQKKGAVSTKLDGNGDGCSNHANVHPRSVFHHGIPSSLGASSIAYENSQGIVAISTSDGRIKLFGNYNTQLLLESPSAAPSKFLQFVQNKGILFNVTCKNHIEVWDLVKVALSDEFVFKGEVASFGLTLHSEYIFIGDSLGNVTLLKLNLATSCVTEMNYKIPFSSCRGAVNEKSTIHPIVCILPQPKNENKRVLLIFSDGLITLWDLEENAVVHSAGPTCNHTQSEKKQVSCGCWVCPIGGKVAIGYTNGELLIFTITSISHQQEFSHPSIQPTKLNVGFRTDKTPISSLKWKPVDGKSSRLYVSGSSELQSTNMIQIVLLNDQTATRIVKLGLHLSEPCVSMEIIENPLGLNGKNNQELLILIGKSGRVYAYDDHSIVRYLLQSQARNSSLPPEQVQLSILQGESSITASLLLSNSSTLQNFGEQDYSLLAKGFPSLFSLVGKHKDGGMVNFPGFRNIRKLYISGHRNGNVRFWDVSCAIPLPIFSVTHQNEGDSNPNGVPVTSLLFDIENLEFISGDSSGIVRVYKFEYTTLPSFPGSSRRGNAIEIQAIKVIKVAGSVLSLSILESSRYLAVGSVNGNIMVYDLKLSCMRYQTQVTSETSSGITSLRFQTCNMNGIMKNCLLVATSDCSIFSLDGSIVTSHAVHPKKPSNTLFMDVIDGKFVVICSEKAAHVYSLNHCLQGVRKIYSKKKFQPSSCLFASICFCESRGFLALVLSSGNLEIRSLPDLSLIKVSSIRGFGYSQQKSAISCSRDGLIIMVNEDQEAIFLSIFLHSEQFIILNSVGEVYRKDTSIQEEESLKKKNLLSSLIGRNKEPKSVEADILPIEKQPTNDEIDLQIDDIDLEDDSDKCVQPSQKAPSSKGKFSKKFNFLKGKVKEIKGKMLTNEITSSVQSENVGPVEGIKKKYGYSQIDGALTPAKSAQNNLNHNLVKLQGINEKMSTMNDYAMSFSSMAKDLLRTVEKDK